MTFHSLLSALFFQLVLDLFLFLDCTSMFCFSKKEKKKKIVLSLGRSIKIVKHQRALINGSNF